jgi:undecaprenyl-diphosphatase
VAVGVQAIAERLLGVDAELARRLNALARRASAMRLVVRVSAQGLAGVEVLLMVALGLAGRKRQAGRMLAAVGLVYVASEGLGLAWNRTRPFDRRSDVEPLVQHTSQRSFPSRHVASGLAMAAIGQRAHPRLGAAMAGVAWLLGVSRVMAGLHYPSDVVCGAVLGSAVGRALRN